MKLAHLYNIVQRWTFLAAVVVLIAVNYYFFFGAYQGASLAEITDRYYTSTTPALYAFSIWSLIYATLLIFGFFQLKRGKEILLFRRVFPYFLAIVVCNIGWLFSFGSESLLLSTAFIFALLILLAIVYQKFARTKHLLGTTRRYFFQVPFSMYLAWITVAAMLNLAIFLQASEVAFYTANELVFGIIFKTFVFASALYMLYRHNDYIFPAVIAWGVFAIGLEQTGLQSIIAKFMAAGIVLVEVIHFTRDRIHLASYGNIKG